jgi:hypothetical protein
VDNPRRITKRNPIEKKIPEYFQQPGRNMYFYYTISPDSETKFPKV